MVWGDSNFLILIDVQVPPQSDALSSNCWKLYFTYYVDKYYVNVVEIYPTCFSQLLKLVFIYFRNLKWVCLKVKTVYNIYIYIYIA